jgi:hypothetical protein
MAGEQGEGDPPGQPTAPLALPVGAELVEAVRRLVLAGDFTARGVAQLQVTLGLGADEVRGLLSEAAALEVADRLPPDLARAESMAFARKVRTRCYENGDAKGSLAAQAHMDRLSGVDPRTAGKVDAAPPGDVMPRAEVVALLRRIAGALAPWPEAVDAFRGVVAAQSESGASQR